MLSGVLDLLAVVDVLEDCESESDLLSLSEPVPARLLENWFWR